MKPKIMFFILLALILATLAASSFSFLYFNDILAENRDNLAKKQLELHNSYDHLDYLGELEQQTDGLESELGSLTGIYPKDKLQSEFIAQLRRLAIENGLTITDDTITFQSTNGLPTATSQLEKSASVASLIGMPVQISVSGSYRDQLNFLKDLETFRRLTNVSSIDMQSSNGNTVNNLITIDVLVQQTLVHPEDAKKPASATNDSQANTPGGTNSGSGATQ